VLYGQANAGNGLQSERETLVYVLLIMLRCFLGHHFAIDRSKLSCTSGYQHTHTHTHTHTQTHTHTHTHTQNINVLSSQGQATVSLCDFYLVICRTWRQE